jgi:glycosyltransferase involved in cell wall biosynthesis
VARLIVVEDLAGRAVVGRGGTAMYVMQILNGLARLGHDVVFVEFLDEEPDAAAVSYFRSVVERWWSPQRAALILEPTLTCRAGLQVDAVRAAAADAEAVITLAAHYRREPWPLLEDVRPRILLEQDPGYTQLWAADEDPVDFYGEQDVHFTVGANVGTERSALPAVGIDWHHLFNPVVLDWWAGETPVQRNRFTTVGAWRDYGYLEWEGRVIGPKAEEFERFMDLPGRTGEGFELALGIDPDDPDLPRLLEHGWTVADAAALAAPSDYRDYIRGSLGEFSCAKGGYVATRSGWFSDRSACYLAAGRPVVLQATGFEDVLPTGAGLFAVGDVEEAARAVRQIRADYPRHSRAARQIAREHLDSDRLLARMLAEAGVA